MAIMSDAVCESCGLTLSTAEADTGVECWACRARRRPVAVHGWSGAV